MNLEVERVVGRLRPLDVEPRIGRREVQAGRRNAGIVVEQHVALERRLAGEHRPDHWWAQAFDPGVQVEGETPRRALASHSDVAFRPYVGAGREVELGVELVERPRAFETEIRRWQARKIDEMGENAARGFGGLDVHRQPVGRGHVAQQRAEFAGRIEPPRVEAEVESFGGRPQRRPAGDIEPRREPDDRLAERKLIDRELFDDHLERQFGQDRLRRLRRRVGVGRRRLRRNGPAQKVDMADGQLIDLEPAAEQGQPVPDQPDLVDLEPRPVAVGQHDVVDRHVGAEHAIHRPDRYGHRRRGEGARDEIGDHALVGLVGPRRREEDEDQGEERRPRCRWEKEETRRHQKDCPMLA